MSNLEELVSRLERVTVKLEQFSTNTGPGNNQQSDDVVHPFVAAYDEYLSGPVSEYVDLSTKIGDVVESQASVVKDLFDEHRIFLCVASKSKPPQQADLMQLIEPMSSKIQQIQSIKDKNRTNKFVNHLTGIAESITALGWVTVSPAPGPYIIAMKEAGQFYTNRALKEFKDVDEVHAKWVRSWITLLDKLQAYVKEHHATGVSWNKNGGDALQAALNSNKNQAAQKAATPPAPAGGAPPPPPPPPVEAPTDVKSPPSGDDEENKRNALFSSINQGESVTKGLKKVSDDMKTHKNPALRLKGPQPFKAPSAESTGFKPFNSNKKHESVHPPKLALDNKKWSVEYQIDNRNVVIEDCNIKQTVYIYKCKNSTVQIKSKVNSIVMDCCSKTGLVFEGVLSTMDFINCQSVKMQVLKGVPTINIDKTDGCMVYLSKDSIDSEIITAKSSEMNILIPTEDGDYKELVIPEQFKTQWNGKSLETKQTDIIS